MEQQNYSNHRRYVPGFHFVTGASALLLFLYGIVRLVRVLMSGNYKFSHVAYTGIVPFLTGLTFLLLFWYSRRFAVKVQDRVIRVEENMRHYMITGKPADSRLTMSQITAIRFAPDDEYLQLMQEAIDKNMSPDDIKKAIKNWKADHHRA